MVLDGIHIDGAEVRSDREPGIGTIKGLAFYRHVGENCGGCDSLSIELLYFG